MKPLIPQEVRLGNLTSHGVVVLIEDVRFITRQEDLNYYGSNKIDIYPVPLTPEILEGFGFEESGFEMYSAHGFDLCYITTDEYFQIELRMPFGDWKVYPIKHAHTLQNFIHAISGVELVYKQNKTE